ncbi:MAG: four helix bundle suffix domain-containing protein [Bacteroidales bacterium]|nr:four helix bundle suffix domain-containing protein [Bacteroidales bacterium]
MPTNSVFKKTADWRNLRVYQKSDVLCQITEVFCRRFMPRYGDRTVDQMVQAARSGKQNIVEGSENGKTSSEMELKLLNVARASIAELREDYEDYLKKHRLLQWDKSNPRFAAMLQFCRQNNEYMSYEPIMEKISDEEFCNMAITLCHFTDSMLNSYLKYLEQRFITEGGIKERMHSARTGYRREQDAKMVALEQENQRLKELLRHNGVVLP